MPLKRPIEFETAFETYTATEVIGEGGAARVYRASDSDGQFYAVKLLDARWTTAKRKRFKNEIEFCSRNKHPNIVSVIDRGTYSNDGQSSVFYVMPLYSGSFRKLLNRGIQPDKAVMYFSQILNGVEAAHLLGVVHRDLKPENILLDEGNDQLLIADFGIAQFQEEELFTAVETKESDRLANFQYAAPEQRARGGHVDHRTDIYALGLILHEMFTGEVISGTEYRTIANVSPDYAYLDDIVSQMIRQDLETRLPSIEAVKQRLIAHKNSFVTQQRISELKGKVVPASEIDDPLIADPPRLIGFDWEDGVLTLVLSCSVNKKWIWALENMGSYSSLWGKDPSSFRFLGNSASVPATEQQVQSVIDYFKGWLPQANAVYEREIAREQEAAEEQRRKFLEEDIRKEEARKRVLENVRI